MLICYTVQLQMPRNDWKEAYVYFYASHIVKIHQIHDSDNFQLKLLVPEKIPYFATLSDTWYLILFTWYFLPETFYLILVDKCYSRLKTKFLLPDIFYLILVSWSDTCYLIIFSSYLLPDSCYLILACWWMSLVTCNQILVTLYSYLIILTFHLVTFIYRSTSSSVC